jgi:hypothetical protein
MAIGWRRFWALARLASGTASLIGCAAPQVAAPLAPGTTVAARFGAGASPGFRSLTVFHTPEESAPRAGFAETASEFADVWDDFARGEELTPPAVDFRAEVVVFFTERAFCNDGVLAGFVLTSAGELIPSVRRSERVCNLASVDCPHVRVYVAALPRAAFPPGHYALLAGLHEPWPFAVRTTPPLERRRGASEKRAPVDPEAAHPRHPRHALVIRRDQVEHGVWVRSDSVWIMPDALEPEQPPGIARMRGFEPDQDLPERICDLAGCTRVLTRSYCWPPQCPSEGQLLIAEEPLGVREAWPSEKAAWERLISELQRDPVLAARLGAPARFPEKQPAPEPRIGWASNRYNDGSFEIGASAEAGRGFGSDAWLVGPSLRLGWRNNTAVHDTTSSGYLLEPLFGDSWGADLRLAALRELAPESSPRTLWRIGVALGADNALGSTSTSRVRLSSALGTVVPEIGFVYVSNQALKFSTSNAFAASFLLTPRLALEARPAFTLLFGPEHQGGTEALLTMSLGLVVRTDRSPCD